MQLDILENYCPITCSTGCDNPITNSPTTSPTTVAPSPLDVCGDDLAWSVNIWGTLFFDCKSVQFFFDTGVVMTCKQLDEAGYGKLLPGNWQGRYCPETCDLC